MSPDKARQIGNDLACLAASIAEIAEEIKALYDFDHDTPEEESGPGTRAAPPKQKPKDLTLEDVRKILAEKSSAGFREQVQALIKSRGVERLSQIDPAEYSALMLEAEALT